MFSILIPTWNNLDYLKLCIESVRKNSAHEHEILVHVNDNADGTLDWVRAQGLTHTYTPHNVGVCLSVNSLAAKASRDWILYLNDDMVCAPGWDTALLAAAKATTSPLAMFFATLIEPTDTGNPLVVVRDFGRTPQAFDAARLTAQFATDPRADVLGHGSQPTLVRRAAWIMAGGYSIEFGPGMSSDDDLLMKFYVMGGRDFRIVGTSRVYHFACRSTGRVRRNRGGRTFVMKWGITQQEFKTRYLAHAHESGSEGPAGFPSPTATGRLKRMAYAFGGYPLGDLAAWDPAPGRHFPPDGD
jgi:glycosyltransferase involved in cell wall biosynthesis